MWRASLFPFGTSWLHLDQCKIHPHSFLCLNQLWSTQLHKFLQAASVVRMCAPGWLQATCPYPRDPSDEETRFRNQIFRWRNNVEGSADSAKGHSCALLLHWSRWDLFQPAAAAWGARSFVFWLHPFSRGEPQTKGWWLKAAPPAVVGCAGGVQPGLAARGRRGGFGAAALAGAAWKRHKEGFNRQKTTPGFKTG